MKMKDDMGILFKISEATDKNDLDLTLRILLCRHILIRKKKYSVLK